MRWLSEVEGKSGVLLKDRERTVRAHGQCAPLRERCNVLSWEICTSVPKRYGVVELVLWELHEMPGSSPSKDTKDVGCRGGHEEVARVARINGGFVVHSTVATREPLLHRLWLLG